MHVSPDAAPTLKPIEPTGTHFGTAGRLLSYFPQINLNGITFLEEDITPDLVQTLVGSLVDIAHVKPLYGVTSNLVPGAKNATIGAIVDAKMVAGKGIDISCKLERIVTRGFGYTPEDFTPGSGGLATYSQECEFNPLDGHFIVVDKSKPDKILHKIPYADGVALGMSMDKISRCVSGKWEYVLHEGNPVYYAPKPSSFSGVAHLAAPADVSAVTYRMAAAANLAAQVVEALPGADLQTQLDKARELIKSDYNGMDGPPRFPPQDEVGLSDGAAYNGNDLNVYASDFLTHPDILSGVGVDKWDHSEDDANNPKIPDDHFAANYSCMDYSNVADSKPSIMKKRAFRVKNEKGEFDRRRLIAAYRALAGMRGRVDVARDLPNGVKAHAFALVRQGLKETKPKTQKGASSIMDPEIETLNQRIKELQTAQERMVSGDAHAAVVAEVETLKAAVAAKEAEHQALSTENTELKAKVKEFQDAALSAERLAALSAVLPYTEDEKKADTFGEFVKSLAGVSEDRFETMKLQRDNTRLAQIVSAAQTNGTVRALSGQRAPLAANPVPANNAGVETVVTTVGDIY
jgi:hypothetical protein